jgi:hypothetical protein
VAAHNAANKLALLRQVTGAVVAPAAVDLLHDPEIALQTEP